jgi:hypothetical protein
MSTVTVSPLRQRMIEDMNARKLCAETQRGHIHSCRRFAAFLKQSPDTATAEDIRDLTTYGYHRLPGHSTGWWTTRRAHQRGTSASGPTLATKGPLGGLLQYDAAGQRVAAVTDATGNTATATTDARVWQTASLTDANGHTTVDQFDALGRVTATIGALDSPSLPTATFAYAAGPISVVDATARVTHGGADMMPATTWIDGSGRVMGQAAPAAQAGQWIVCKAVANNSRGLPISTFLPYQVSGPGWQPAPAGTGAAHLPL